MEPLTALNVTEDKAIERVGNEMLEAWHDKVAGITAFSDAIVTAPLFRDGYRLVIADEDRKLKVCDGSACRPLAF